MPSAAVLPWCSATSQCSIRSRAPPWTTLSYSAMSPAAKMSGAEVGQASVGDHAAALADLQAGLLGQRHVRA